VCCGEGGGRGSRVGGGWSRGGSVRACAQRAFFLTTSLSRQHFLLEPVQTCEREREREKLREKERCNYVCNIYKYIHIYNVYIYIFKITYLYLYIGRYIYILSKYSCLIYTIVSCTYSPRSSPFGAYQD
jgi:hypothetical protein